MFVEVRCGNEAGLGDGDQRQNETAVRDANGAFEKLQILGKRSLMEYMQLIFSRRNAIDMELAGFAA